MAATSEEIGEQSENLEVLGTESVKGISQPVTAWGFSRA